MIMKYEPYQTEMLPVLILTSFISVFGILITIKLIFKWRERRAEEIMYLSLVFIFLTLAVISLTIGLYEALITGYRKEIYMFTLPLAYVGVIVADIFLFVFSFCISIGSLSHTASLLKWLANRKVAPSSAAPSTSYFSKKEKLWQAIKLACWIK